VSWLSNETFLLDVIPVSIIGVEYKIWEGSRIGIDCQLHYDVIGDLVSDISSNIGVWDWFHMIMSLSSSIIIDDDERWIDDDDGWVLDCWEEIKTSSSSSSYSSSSSLSDFSL